MYILLTLWLVSLVLQAQVSRFILAINQWVPKLIYFSRLQRLLCALKSVIRDVKFCHRGGCPSYLPHPELSPLPQGEAQEVCYAQWLQSFSLHPHGSCRPWKDIRDVLLRFCCILQDIAVHCLWMATCEIFLKICQKRQVWIHAK